MAEVILRKDVRNIGKAGQVVKVKDGYARNYLIPKGYAMPATKQNLKIWEQERRKMEKELEKQKERAKELVEKIEKLSINIVAEANEEETLYGSITAVHIWNALSDEGVKIDKDAIELDTPIKKLGIYTVPVRVHPEIVANLKVWVVRK